MKIFASVLAVVLLLLVVIVSTIVGAYNSLVGQREQSRTEFANIETQLQRRFDLVPNLVESVKGAMTQEQSVFKAIADARTKYAGAKSGTPDKLEAASDYQSAIARLLVVMENYPILKSIDTVQDLMTQLEGTENRISVARQRYNETIQVYNQHLQSFPTNILNLMWSFEQMKRFEAVSEAQTVPKVNFK